MAAAMVMLLVLYIWFQAVQLSGKRKWQQVDLIWNCKRGVCVILPLEADDDRGQRGMEWSTVFAPAAQENKIICCSTAATGPGE